MEPCSARTRQCIVEDIARGVAKTKIARTHGLHPNTIYKIARQARAAAAQPLAKAREALLRLRDSLGDAKLEDVPELNE